MRREFDKDINDYMGKGYMDVNAIDFRREHPFFRIENFSIDNPNVYVDEEHYKAVAGRINEITESLFVGMVAEYKELFEKSKIPVVEISDISEQDKCKRIDSYISKCDERLKNCYNAKIIEVLHNNGYKGVCCVDELSEEQILGIQKNQQIQDAYNELWNEYYIKVLGKMGKIRVKYERKNLFNSLLYVYCQLYDETSKVRSMLTPYNNKDKYIDLWEKTQAQISRCKTLLKNCKNIKVTMLKGEISNIAVQSKGTEQVPDICYLLALYDLTNNENLKWLVDRDGIMVQFTEGQDFDAAKKWLDGVLKPYTERKHSGYYKNFALSLNGLYRYIMDCKFVNNLKFPIYSVYCGVNEKTPPKEKAIELIRVLLDLPTDKLLSQAIYNYIDRRE